VDDITFAYRGASGPESSTTLYFDKARQLDVRQLVFGRVYHHAATGEKSALYDYVVRPASRPLADDRERTLEMKVV